VKSLSKIKISQRIVKEQGALANVGKETIFYRLFLPDSGV